MDKNGLKELVSALEDLEREKEISKDSILEAISNSLMTACKNHFRGAENIHIEVNKETCEYKVFATKDVVDGEVRDSEVEISLEEALLIDPNAKIDDQIDVEIDSKEFGRIATQNAKNVIIQKIREGERLALYNQYHEKEHDIVTGVLQRKTGDNWIVDLGRADAILKPSEMVEGEIYKPNERMKFYIVDVKNPEKENEKFGENERKNKKNNKSKGPIITVSRTHPDLVKKLFESEVVEIKDGTVEIKSIAREAGSRTKMAVYSQNPMVDAVGACVGVNGARVNAIVKELRDEKIDIVNWDENPADFICNALSPAQIVDVFVLEAEDSKSEDVANVIVPDDQLSLAIGKSGQNARLAAKLTNHKIDIKSETQAKDTKGFRIEDYEEEYYEEELDSSEDGDSDNE